MGNLREYTCKFCGYKVEVYEEMSIPSMVTDVCYNCRIKSKKDSYNELLRAIFGDRFKL